LQRREKCYQRRKNAITFLQHTYTVRLQHPPSPPPSTPKLTDLRGAFLEDETVQVSSCDEKEICGLGQRQITSSTAWDRVSRELVRLGYQETDR
jgi:hypothetical protein